ncbi:hypothetical protein QZM35_23175 [Burkholderia sp. AU45274]|uniref:hypothetical protein n=1 Tax=Burkholderia sp. AU45274 TaxID=3059205 RepID=UPI0026508214|nr:hypothetical protein [Burkholderia sp. AU45274]MDN7490618.1 hypothetical protein [Burkholderia sp. AU45274]
MKNWAIFVHIPLEWDAEFARYSRRESAWRYIHSVPAENEGDALHKAKNFFAKRQRKNTAYYPTSKLKDIRVMDDRLYVTGCYEIDSVGTGRD